MRFRIRCSTLYTLPLLFLFLLLVVSDTTQWTACAEAPRRRSPVLSAQATQKVLADKKAVRKLLRQRGSVKKNKLFKPLIVDGVPDTSNESVVALFSAQERIDGFRLISLCSGTVIHPRFVLTAAHCVDRRSLGLEQMFYVVPGFDVARYIRDQTAVKRDGYRVVQIRVEPNFSLDKFEQGHDIALVLLDRDIPVPVAPVSARSPEINDTVVLSGYGIRNPDDARSMGLRFQSQQSLRNIHYKRTPILEFYASTGSVCPGDSGGPAFLRGAVAGVASYTYIGCRSGSFHTSVAPYKSWIDYSLQLPPGIELTNTESDLPVLGDFDGDGRLDHAVYRPYVNYRESLYDNRFTMWFIAYSGGGAEAIQWGLAGQDMPVPGKYFGSERATVASYRAAEGNWYIRRNGQASVHQWGGPGDFPVPADYDGDGSTDLAVYRRSTGEWHIRVGRLADGGNGVARVIRFPGQRAGDIPVPGNYFGTGAAALAMYRPSSGEFFLLAPSGGVSSVKMQFPGGIPVPFHFDSDGRKDFAVYHFTAGLWEIASSSITSKSQFIQFGQPVMDLPVPGRWGGGKMSLAVWRSETSEYYVRTDGMSEVKPFGKPGKYPFFEHLGTNYSNFPHSIPSLSTVE